MNRGCRSSLQPGRALLAMMLWQLPMTILKRRPRPAPTASTRASSQLPRRGATATASTFALSPSSHASSAVVNPPTRIICATYSRARSAARSAMSSRSRSVAGIIVRCIAHATSTRGGGRPASTRSKLPAGSGGRRAEWDSSSLNDRHHLGRMQLPHLLTPRPGTSTPPQRRTKNPACRMFPASRTSAAGCSRITNDDVET